MKFLTIAFFLFGIVFAQKENTIKILVLDTKTPSGELNSTNNWILGVSDWLGTQEYVKSKFLPNTLNNKHDKIMVETPCNEFSCAVEEGTSFGAEWVVVTGVEKKSGGYLMSAQVVDVNQKTSIRDYRFSITRSTRELATRFLELQDSLKVLIAQKVDSERNQVDQSKFTVIKSQELTGVFTKKDSPYLLNHSAIVPSGEAWIIEPGVKIYINNHDANINIFGKWFINGTIEEPVEFLSAKKYPQAGDWQRIIVKSTSKAVLSNLIIKHSNYGLNIINSSAQLSNLSIKQNKIRGLYVVNSAVNLQDSKVEGGHEVGVEVSGYSKFKLIRTFIQYNQVGLSASKNSQVEFLSSRIERNNEGVVQTGEFKIKAANNRISYNNAGWVTSKEVFNKMLSNSMDSIQSGKGESAFLNTLGVKNNSRNLKWVNADLIKKQISNALVSEMSIVKPSIVLPGLNLNTDLEIAKDDESNKEPLSMLGNFRIGSEYGKVLTRRHVERIPYNEEINYGERYTNDYRVDDWIHSLSVFSVAQWNDKSIEVNLDAQYDDWAELQLNPWSVYYKDSHNEAWVGNLNESGPSLAISGLGILGAKYKIRSDGFSDLKPLLAISAAWGEEVRPLDISDKNLEIFGETIDEGNSIPQRLTGVFDVNWNPSKDQSVHSGFIWSKEHKTDLPFFRMDLDPDAETRDPMLDGQSFFTQWEGLFFKQNLSLSAQGVWGSADSSLINKQKAINGFISNYNITSEADTLRSLYLLSGKPNANIFESLLPSNINLSGEEALAEIDSIKASIQSKSESEKFVGFKTDPDYLAFELKGEYYLKNGSIGASFEYIGSDIYSPGASGLLNNSRSYNAFWQQSIGLDYDLSIDYSLNIENVNQGDRFDFFGVEKGNVLGLSDSDFGPLFVEEFGIETRYLHSVSIDQNYRFLEQFEFEVGYELSWWHQFNSAFLEKDTTDEAGIYTDPYFNTSNDELIKVYYGDDHNVDASKWSEYIDAPDSLAFKLQEKELSHEINVGLTWSPSNNLSIRIGAEWEGVFDYSIWHKSSTSYKTLKLEGETYENLGYGLGLLASNYINCPVEINYSNDFISQSLGAAVSRQSYRYLNQDVYEWNIDLNSGFEWINNRLETNFGIGVRNEISKYDDENFYLEGTDGTLFYFFDKTYESDSTVVVNPVQRASSESSEVDGSTEAEEYVLKRNTFRTRETQFDPYFEFDVRWTQTKRLSFEGMFNLYRFERPENMDEENVDWTAGIYMQYSF